jgi:hypothetical protein
MDAETKAFKAKKQVVVLFRSGPQMNYRPDREAQSDQNRPAQGTEDAPVTKAFTGKANEERPITAHVSRSPTPAA